MHTTVARRLDTHLTRIANHISQLRQVDLSREDGCQEALLESREVLHDITMYRSMLANTSR